MNSSKRAGISQIELVIVCIATVILSSLSIAAIRASRDEKQIATCKNKLRQLAVAAHDYHDANDRLPAGTLGPVQTPTVDQFENGLWKDHQYTSSIALMLPFLEQQKIYKKVRLVAYDYRRSLEEHVSPDGDRLYQWFGDLDGIFDAASEKLELAICPSDAKTLDAEVKTTVITQPTVSEQSRDAVDKMYTMDWHDNRIKAMEQASGIGEVSLQRTSYLGCNGAHGAGHSEIGDFSRFSGAMQVRAKASLIVISNQDGTSRTIMLGETIGEISEGKRVRVQSWFLGGLARGYGDVPWLGEPTEDNPFFGTANKAAVYGFGSMHEKVVNFALCDASVYSFSRDIDKNVYMQLCGRNDGGSAKPEYAVNPEAYKKMLKENKKKAAESAKELEKNFKPPTVSPPTLSGAGFGGDNSDRGYRRTDRDKQKQSKDKKKKDGK